MELIFLELTQCRATDSRMSHAAREGALTSAHRFSVFHMQPVDYMATPAQVSTDGAPLQTQDQDGNHRAAVMAAAKTG